MVEDCLGPRWVVSNILCENFHPKNPQGEEDVHRAYFVNPIVDPWDGNIYPAISP